MIPVNKLFYEFDAEEAGKTIGRGFSSVGKFFHGVMNPDDKPKYPPGFKPKTFINKDAEVSQYKSGINRGTSQANIQHDTKMRTNTDYRNKQLAKGAGYAVSNMANKTANWVGQNQGVVKGAGLVGAGVLAHKMMNRKKPGM